MPIVRLAKKPSGVNQCIYCGAKNPDSEDQCPNGGRHTLVSSSDKQIDGQGYGPGPGDRDSKDHPMWMADENNRENNKTHKEAHGFAQTDKVLACPFCGSSGISGGSDGVVTCSFCNTSFTVQIEPSYPFMPMFGPDGQPMNMNGNPDPNGLAVPGQELAIPQNLDPETPDMGGEGSEFGEDGNYESEDEGAGGGVPHGASYTSHFYLTQAGDVLDTDRYIRHLAIRNANNKPEFLASLRGN